MKDLFFRKIPWLSLILLIAFNIIITNPLHSFAETKPDKKTTDICVVYDNSASTYQDETWCRYKYALEIMASFVDYDNGGRLYIYPLCSVSLDGRKDSASKEPISITSYADIGKISNMLTTSPANTPFEPVEYAYHFLLEESVADSKQMVLFSDGIFDGFNSAKEFENRLLQMAEDGNIGIHYFGSGDAVNITAHESQGLYSCKMSGLVDTQQLISFSTDLCSSLFNQTNALTSKSSLTDINVSAHSKIIVFANGKSSTVLSLTNSKGVSIPLKYDTGKHTYSTTKAIGFTKAPIDTSLGSCISIFESTESGKYTLNCENAESITIFIQNGDSPDNTVTEHRNNFVTTRNIVYISFILLIITVIVAVFFIAIHKKKQKAKEDETKKKTESSSLKTGYAFISYSTKNQSSADAIRNLFHKTDIATWMAPYDIPAGSKYAAVIGGAIKNCSCFLLLLTDDSQKSKWVPKEVERAVNYGKIVIPVQLEKVVLNNEFEMYISTDQILPIKKINQTSAEIQDLIKIVKAHTQASDCQ